MVHFRVVLEVKYERGYKSQLHHNNTFLILFQLKVVFVYITQ